jgi:hypothetical protein
MVKREGRSIVDFPVSPCTIFSFALRVFAVQSFYFMFHAFSLFTLYLLLLTAEGVSPYALRLRPKTLCVLRVFAVQIAFAFFAVQILNRPLRSRRQVRYDSVKFKIICRRQGIFC